LFDPLGIDVTQTTIPREVIEHAKLHPTPDVGWVGDRKEKRWGEKDCVQIGSFDEYTKCNGRMRMVKRLKGEQAPEEPIKQLPKDETEDIPMRPWVRKTGRGVDGWSRNEDLDPEEVLRGGAPARLISKGTWYGTMLVPSRDRRIPTTESTEYPCMDGRKQPRSAIRQGRPFNQTHLQVLRGAANNRYLKS